MNSVDQYTRSLTELLGSYKTARSLANVSTVPAPTNPRRSRIIPFGFVQSVALASLVLAKSALGSFLASLGSRGLIATVYVDDIIISSSDLESPLLDTIDELKAKSERSRFPIAVEKTIGPVSCVRAFNIEVGGGRLRVAEDRMDEFRDDLRATNSPEKRTAILSYVRSVNPHQAKVLDLS